MRTDQKLFILKCLLAIFLVILWIEGSAVFGTLLWLRLDYWTNEYLDVDQSLDRYLILIYVSLVDGVLMLIFSIFGLVGAIKGLKWCLVVYLTSLCLAIALTVAGSIYGFVYREELRNTISKNDLIGTLAKTRYNGEPNSRITRAFDIMQSELGCCGGDSFLDYTDSNWYRAFQESRENMAPLSCCKDYFRRRDGGGGGSGGAVTQEYCSIYQPFQPGSEKDYNENIYKEGCRTVLVAFLENYIIVAVGIVITAGGLQLFCIIIVSMMIHVLNSLYVPQPDDIVYDMARNQEKSPYPSRNDYRDYYV